jgi:plasmid stabilization system protein ParE
MTSFRILSEASEELEACVTYYNSQRSNLGTEFLAEFEKTTERILKLPSAARLVGEEIRSRPIHRFPFYVLYCSKKDEITIVAVAHRRRRPRYWLDRT